MSTGVERLACLARGELPDRVPVLCNLLDQGAREMGMSIKKYYSNGENVAEGQIRLRRKYGYDGVWGFFYLGHEAEILGSRKTIYSDHGPPNVGDMIIKKNKDIESLEIPKNISEIPAFQEKAKCISLLKKEFGGKYPVISPAISCFSLPAILMGMEKWIRLLFLGPETLRDELLEKCSLFCIRHIRALREAGADVIPYTNAVASMDFIDLQYFKTFALPWIKRDLTGHNGHEGRADGENNGNHADHANHDNRDIVYFCGGGRINATIPLLKEHIGLGIYYPNPMDDVAETKRLVGNKGISVGVINDIKLMQWRKNQIEMEVKRIMDIGAPGGGFIFGTLVMPFLIPEEKIDILLQAAYKYGDYSRWAS